MQRYLILLAAITIALVGCADNSDDAGEGEIVSTESSQTGDTTTTEVERSPNVTQGAQNGDMVSVHYIGTLDDGSEFDSSYGGDTLSFEVGTDQVIAGFDAAVRGMAVGDKTTVRIPPEDAYGAVDSELIFSVPIEEAPEDVAVGDEVLIGGVTYGVVTEISGDQVTIDTNHRFAGQALTFEIELMSINE